MAIELREQLRIDYLEDERLRQAGVALGILRLDELHPLVSGNKWFKLKENLKAARDAGCNRLLTFGGAYSNHLLATAAAAKYFSFAATGIVRGLHAQALLSDTLQECMTLGMDLVFVSREVYSRKGDDVYLDALQQRYPDAWIVPEGGSNAAGLSGAAGIAAYIPSDSSHVALALGTGTTFAGIRTALDNRIAMTGFPVMKGGAYLETPLGVLIPPAQNNWLLSNDYHFGGFGRHTDTLITFMNDFYEQHSIPLDFVYTGKMMYGIFDRIRTGQIPAGSRVICVHTGGLQGNRSIAQRLCYGPSYS
ncbi:1-aminocyclopropane-1-carboxylate deaminase/D-cysteine desulfhydrase [Taibaiella helva]|uniref:1-aminocyclopropane-1-carboxylate deaminase/D-cysteine desulfhydrase n=1 Tax=Taibaiella helva TaxID=2301235 RepID=UPI000E575E5C|nr:pyridoxal-phosphate dependent enzyme [Taibaiella helva]